MDELTCKTRMAPSILIVDDDIASRHAIADYLRHCGYAVVEVATTDEAMKALGPSPLRIDVILCDARAVGSQSAFRLSTWVRANRPELEVHLVGSLEGILDTAADLCENGPHVVKRYEPQAIVDYIEQLRASRDRASDRYIDG